MKRLLMIALAAGLATTAMAHSDTPAPTAPAPSPTAPAAQIPPEEFAGPSNAALVYYRAWMVVDSPAWEAVVRENDRDVLADLQPAVARFMAAAAIRHCDWGVEYADGPYTLLPHLAKLRDSARLLTADAGRLAAAADMAGAVERLEAALRMSHQTRRDRTVISSLIGAAISNIACDAVNEIAGARRITPEQARRLLAAAELPASPFGAREAIEAEGIVFIGWAREHLTGPQAGRELASLVAVEELPDDHPMLRMSGEELARDLGRSGPFYEAAAALFDEPDPVERMQALERRLAEGEFGVAATVLASSTHKIREGIDRAVQKREDIIARLEMAANR